MRADAARNLEAVPTTGARMLAPDPGASVASIAAEADVDRRTVYRRFASREELLAAIHESRLTAIEHAIEDARLREAPVAVALTPTHGVRTCPEERSGPYHRSRR